MQPKAKQKIILVTTTRADWGILSPLARALVQHDGVSLTVAAGNMHLLSRYGHTVDAIKADGFIDVVALDVCDSDDDSHVTRTTMAAATATSLARLIAERDADAVIILGDRYEMLGAATAALIAGVPIIHLHGGEISEGAIDDSVRHALSKMATLHLPATRKAAERLMMMGEEPSRIVQTGAIGVQNALNLIPMSREELSRSLEGFDVSPDKTLLVTFHPVTRHPEGIPTAQQVDNLIGAIEDVPDCNVIITFPNNDTGSTGIIEKLEAFAKANKDRVYLVKSLGSARYISAMHHAKAVVGNTSSGILEAPSTPAYTIDIGPRQQGRERALSVIHVDDNRNAIAGAIKQVLEAPRRNPRPEDNPYFLADSVQRAVDAITEVLPGLSMSKKFHTLSE